MTRIVRNVFVATNRFAILCLANVKLLHQLSRDNKFVVVTDREGLALFQRSFCRLGRDIDIDMLLIDDIVPLSVMDIKDPERSFIAKPFAVKYTMKTYTNDLVILLDSDHFFFQDIRSVEALWIGIVSAPISLLPFKRNLLDASKSDLSGCFSAGFVCFNTESCSVVESWCEWVVDFCGASWVVGGYFEQKYLTRFPSVARCNLMYYSGLSIYPRDLSDYRDKDIISVHIYRASGIQDVLEGDELDLDLGRLRTLTKGRSLNSNGRAKFHFFDQLELVLIAWIKCLKKYKQRLRFFA